MKRAAAVIILLAFAVALALAANFWEAKPYTQWNNREANRILSESPWAHTFVLRTPNMTQVRRQAGKMANRADEGEGVMSPEMSYAIALRTALPVREAVVRTAALEQKYDNMDSAAKQGFEKQWGPFLAQQFPDKVIISVKYAATASDWDRQLAAYWQTQTLDSIRNDTFMNGPDGKRVPPTAFWVGKGAVREFQVAFPRPSDDVGRDASLSVEFKHPEVRDESGKQPSSRVYAKFNFKDMQYKGTLTY